jgi:pSer/pThr/pTyr-binding forkhead associated (FHA) protein
MDVKLVMFKSNGQRKDIPITSPVTIIGRSEECDLRVPLLSVSRRQCELRIAGTVFKAKDLASSNGTYVNNRRIIETLLKAGDRLVVGPIVFTVQIDGQPEEVLPVKTRGQVMAEKSQAGQDEGFVDLEADVEAHLGSSSSSGTREAIAIDDSTADFDPISALEADPPEKKKKENGK